MEYCVLYRFVCGFPNQIFSGMAWCEDPAEVPEESEEESEAGRFRQVERVED